MAVKIQYPGVAEGIDSDINNLVSILNATRLVPDALFLDELVRVARKELAWEVDYVREKVATLFSKISHKYSSRPSQPDDRRTFSFL